MKQFKQVFNNKGVTLVELIVAMVVMTVITISVAAVLMPLHSYYKRANDLAEVNTILDNISSLIMSDVANASRINPEPSAPANAFLIVTTTRNIIYAYDDDGLIIRSSVSGAFIPVLDKGYFKNKNVTVSCTVSEGLVTIIISLTDDDGFWNVQRSYAARPVGMQ